MLTRIALVASLSVISVCAFANTEAVKKKYLKIEKLKEKDNDRVNVSVCSKNQDQILACDETYNLSSYWFRDVTKPRNFDDAIKDSKGNAGMLSLYPFLMMLNTNKGLPYDVIYFPLFLLSVPAGLLSYPCFLGYEFYKLEIEKRTEVNKLKSEIYPFINSSETTHVYPMSPEAMDLMLEKIKVWGRKI